MTTLLVDALYSPAGTAGTSLPLGAPLPDWSLIRRRLAHLFDPDADEETWFDVPNRDLSPSGARCIVVRKTEHRARYRATVMPVADAVALVRSTLGLNMSEMARVLGVERPTVYSWLSGNAHPRLRNYRRLSRITSLIRRYASQAEPLRAIVRTPDESGRSLVDILAEPSLPESDLVSRMIHAVAETPEGADRRARSSRLHQIAESRGVRMVEQRGELDRVTGKRLGPEER